MSSFPRQIYLYNYISIDRFDGDNLKSSAFFLSHCHSDHMVGLESNDFYQKLKSHMNIKLYLSNVSKVLLLTDKRFSRLSSLVETVPIEEPQIVTIQHEGLQHEITVTLLSAGHCPGSVMFLFEGIEGTCLYTGDFRLPKGSAAWMKHLHSGRSAPRCSPQLQRQKHEYLYAALHERFKTMIHCARSSHYLCLPDMAKIMTTDPGNARIFACFKKERLKTDDWSQWPASDDDELQSTKLKFLNSTLYFTYAALPEEVKVRTGDNSYRLCFAFHSSLSEICDFVRYLNPSKVHANVIPRSGETKESVENRLRKLCSLPHRTVHENAGKIKYQALGKLCSSAEETADPNKKVKRCVLTSALWESSDSDEELNLVCKKPKR